MEESNDERQQEQSSTAGTATIENLSKKKILSKREIDVLSNIKDGMKNPEIAEKFGLSTKTIENHVRNILLKLGVKNRTQAVVQALRSSLIPF